MRCLIGRYRRSIVVIGRRRLCHHDAALARAALCMAIAVRGGEVAGVIFHTDYAEVCVKPRVRGVGLRSRELLVNSSA
jgi:hypothetical protein